jgi:hypothetical protein
LAKNIDALEREIRLLQTELQVRQMLATNTASLVLDRHAGGAEASRGVEQGDPEPSRLNDADAQQE